MTRDGGWATRRAKGWQSQAVLMEHREVERLREEARQLSVQIRFGRDLHKIAEHVVGLCLDGGTSVHTAYLVAGEFTAGLAREWAPEVER